MAHLAKLPDSDPIRNCTLSNNDLLPLMNTVRRVGRPKNNWSLETLRLLWQHTPTSRTLGDIPLNINDQSHRQDLLTALWLDDVY